MTTQPLPQLQHRFLTDAGLETDLIFNRGIDLPYFSSITLLQSDAGREALLDYYCGFLDLAARRQVGFILESATWRASPDWAEPLGMSEEALAGLVGKAITMLVDLKRDYADRVPSLVVSGCVGPRGDGYDPGSIMEADVAAAYHAQQIGWMAREGCEMIAAITMTNVPEALGVVMAARTAGLPVAISFTLETDGKLPTGQSLGDAIAEVDAATGSYPAYYMVNCAHPEHFLTALDDTVAQVGDRVRGVRANASRCSHAELDAMTELDRGDPAELARLHCEMLERHPAINVLGGCCGTDLEHVSAIAEACLTG
ncbi:homocysteine S-methyltransferase family protein [Erythrobacter mangrovi]|uniref:Homocysteine S-methyltransferase family protein n=1 Tax=Erythrobacter mangrovi TaxID=2739433 RepID=A0A7D3Y0C7_9SPHN|nr:homocysteine S-methyltransferase family protein [Erythrobacter mangrovi]QKG71732.1 homocysteine S-methyltransferase family protein [Erythrobacter mangrovi]